MLHFDPSKGIYIEDVPAVRELVRIVWQTAFKGEGLPPLDVSASTPQGQLIDSQTAAIADKDAQLLFLANQFNPATATGRFQDALGKMYFLDRKVAEPTLITCLCSGIPDTVIPAGSLAKTSTNEVLQSVNEGIIGAGGSVEIIFATQATGAIQIGAETVTKIITVVPGWDTVFNPAAGVTGRVEESREAFEARRKASVAAGAHGSAKALYAALANIPDVATLAILENITPQTVELWGVSVPSHSFFISIYGGSDTQIAKTIYEKKDAGAGTAGNTDISYIDPSFGDALYKYKICRPEPLPFGVKVVLRKTAATPDNIGILIKDAISANFNGLGETSGRVSMAAVLYASRFYPTVIDILGKTLVSIEIAAPVENQTGQWTDEITVSADLIPVLDYDDIIIEVLDI